MAVQLDLEVGARIAVGVALDDRIGALGTSLPAPPVITSRPLPPVIQSPPVPPFIVSAPPMRRRGRRGKEQPGGAQDLTSMRAHCSCSDPVCDSWTYFLRDLARSSG